MSTRQLYHQESDLGRIQDMDIVRRLWRFIHPYRWSFFTCMLMLPLISFFSLLQPHLIQVAIDRHLIPHQADGLLWIVMAFAFALLGEFGTRYLQFYLMEKTGQQALRDMRNTIFAHIQRLSISFFHKNPVGRLMTRLTTDVDALQEAFSSGVVTIVGDLFTLFAIVIILLIKSWKLALLTFAILPILLLLTFTFQTLLRQAYRTARVKIARLNTYLQEAVTGMGIVQIFSHEMVSQQEYDEINREYRDATFSQVRYDAILYALVEMISRMTIAGIIWYGAGQSIQDMITLGVLVAFIEYVQKFFTPIQDLSQKYTLIQSALASSERIFQLLDTHEFIQDLPTAEPLPTFQHSLELRNVWFAYERENWVLKDVSFTIKAGEKIALVGHTGAGKTTLVQILMRMYDIQRGQILLDGKDIHQYRLHDLRRLFSIVLQDSFLFSGTLQDNITLRVPSITESDIQKSLHIACAEQLVQRANTGLQQMVRERGANFSSGERQLLSFARAIAHQPQILILDEATANVDTETESLIQQAIGNLLEQQTSIVIAHRLSTIQKVDTIVVLHHGEVAETGSHEELLTHRGLYYKLIQLQYAVVQGE